MKTNVNVPSGNYCYDHNGLCPYWSSKEELPEQENGYCALLSKSDWDINKENGEMEYRTYDHKTQITTIHHDPMSLLFDQVKMCDINVRK